MALHSLHLHSDYPKHEYGGASTVKWEPTCVAIITAVVVKVVAKPRHTSQPSHLQHSTY